MSTHRYDTQVLFRGISTGDAWFTSMNAQTITNGVVQYSIVGCAIQRNLAACDTLGKLRDFVATLTADLLKGPGNPRI